MLFHMNLYWFGNAIKTKVEHKFGDSILNLIIIIRMILPTI